MAANTLSENITLAIKNADGSSFYNLSLKKFTVDSQVMSLGDKITGDVYYKDNGGNITDEVYKVGTLMTKFDNSDVWYIENDVSVG